MDSMAIHSDHIQKALVSELFKELVQKFLHFINDWLLCQKQESTLCSREFHWFHTTEDSTALQLMQFMNHLDKGGCLSIALDFDFESADTNNRDCNHVLVEFVLLFHCSMEHFRHHIS